MPVPSGISKAQPATDGGSLCWTITQHISAWQPLSNNNNKKKTHTSQVSFAHADGGSHISRHMHTDAQEPQTSTYSTTGVMQWHMTEKL